MTYQEVHRVDTRELIRCWQKGFSQRRIAQMTGRSRVTVRRYIEAASKLGLEPGGPEPTDEQLGRLAALNLPGPRRSSTPAADALEEHAARIERWLNRDRLQLTRIHELLGQRGCDISYTSLRRFVDRRGLRPRRPALTIRMAERPAGEVAEMDFARLGPLYDRDRSRNRTVWVLVVTLVFSRHMFVWPLFRQRVEDVVEGLERTWEFFGGVPRFLVIDNYPAAVAGADRHNPRLTRAFLEYAQHRGFIPDPARSHHPQDKPHVERGISYVRERFFKGSQFTGLEDMRQRARHWCEAVAGRRVHGTTRRKPLEVFVDEESSCLSDFDGIWYQVGHWHTAKVQRDHHVTCQYALYSLPHRPDLVGKQVEIRLGSSLVRIYHRGELIKVHPRQAKGSRITDPDDLPPELADYAARDPDVIRRRARQLGPAAGYYANALLGKDPTWARLRSGHSLIKLGRRFGAEALDGACREAIAVDLIDISRLKAILLNGLECESEGPAPAPPPGRFARPGAAFALRGDNGIGKNR